MSNDEEFCRRNKIANRKKMPDGHRVAGKIGRWIECYKCKGTGRIKCWSCHGSGENWSSFHNCVDGACKTCDGAGVAKCYNCYGAGEEYLYFKP